MRKSINLTFTALFSHFIETMKTLIQDKSYLKKKNKITALVFLSTFASETCANVILTTSISYDKAGVPSEFRTMAIETNLPFNTYPIIVCNSSSYTLYGACPTVNQTGPLLASPPPLTSAGIITLRFKSDTNQTTDVKLRAYRTNGCGVRYPWDGTGCASNIPMRLYLGMDNDSMSKVPVGNWHGELIMYQRQVSSSTNFATYTVHLYINVTDTQKQTIYFPAFPGGAPRVDLNLNYRPGAGQNGTVTGTSKLDMCLYAGGFSARKVSLLFQDEGGSSSGRAQGLFSIYRDGSDKTQKSNRLDYSVKVLNPTNGKLDTITNGSQVNWNNANASHIQRQVALPGIPGLSACLPAPLTIVTPAFNYSEKNAGHYTGILRIIYTPSTQS